MKNDEFIARLKEELELEADVNNLTQLKELDEWDSMAAMVLIGFVSDNFSLTLTADDIKEMTTVDSLIEKIGTDKID
jgi:acyl carrier protein